MEFCSPKTFRILLAKSEDEYEAFTLGELLPLGFGSGNLGISGKGAGDPGLAGLSGSGEGDEEYVPDSIKGPERGQGHD